MADAKLNVFNLGTKGVNVDKSPLHLEDGELVVAQNASLDQHGYSGALRKRNGLVHYHNDTAAGSILGFRGAPLGPGPGTGTDDFKTYYLSDAAGTWFKTANSFSTISTISTLAASAATVDSVMLNRRLYYASGTGVRVFDGVQDSLFSDIDATFMIWLGSAEGTLYASVQIGTDGFVYAVDEVGRLTQIGAALPSNYIPHQICLHQNDLFATCTKGGSASTVYRIRLDTATTTTAWTLDYTGGVDYSLPGLVSFNGLLYMVENTPAATASNVYQRSTAGVYSSVDTGPAPCGANSIVFYQGKLYVHWDHYSGTDSVIRRSSDGTTWATVLTYSPTTAGGLGILYSAESKIFSIGYGQTIGHYSSSGASGAWTQFTTPSANEAAFGFFEASGSGPAFGATSTFVVLQGSDTLQILNQAGKLVDLSIPDGITLDTSRPPRFAIFDRFVVVVNTPSRPIIVDADGIVRPLSLLPPVRSIVLDDDGGAGALTGNYKAVQTFVVRDATGNIITESDYSPEMETAFAASADTLDAESLNISPDDDSVTGSNIYRTTNNGEIYFPWITVDGNVLTQSVSDDRSDAALGIVAAPTLGTAPNMSLVASWRGRLWGVDRAATDFARYTESGIMYAWPNVNSILVGREGSDVRGITAFLARRDALGVGRRDSLHQITGTTKTDFRNVVLSESIGVESQETVVVYQDIAWFLSKDGVYKWGPEGVECLSDGHVRSWFVTDKYFNRDRFPYAFASIDPIQNTYRLFLATVGSSVENCWVEYNIGTDTWWGPHKTGALSPTSAGFTYNPADRLLPLIGSNSGFLWKDQDARTDDASVAIDFDVTTMRHAADTPDIEKYWGQPTFYCIPQSSGTLTVTASVGDLNANPSQPIYFDMTKARQRLQRLGVGKHLQFRLRENTVGQDVILTGYEIPLFEVGRR